MEEQTTLDRDELYEALYDPQWRELHRRRNGRRPTSRAAKVSDPGESTGGDALPAWRWDMIDEPDDLEAVGEGDPPFTYRPSRYEQGWLISSLRSFYDEGLITDVLSLVKGGKEASVYLCRGLLPPAGRGAGGEGLLAAKVYRPRMFRSLRNDAAYREGREVLTASGVAGKQLEAISRAIRNKSAFGLEAAHTSWLMHEHTALQTLWAAGAAVPRPVAANDNTVLMGYCGDAHRAAPPLQTVHLDPDEAHRLFQALVRNLHLMLQGGLVHGDLSAYNILYWRGRITLIDFPQVVSLHGNREARWILRRDVERVCEYFARQGVRCRPHALADELWYRYAGDVNPEDLKADWSRIEQVHG